MEKTKLNILDHSKLLITKAGSDLEAFKNFARKLEVENNVVKEGVFSSQQFDTYLKGNNSHIFKNKNYKIFI